MPKPNKLNNFLKADSLLEGLGAQLKTQIEKLKSPPTLALIWVGDDKQTEKFVKAKKTAAAKLGIDFSLHHFNKIEERQISALVGTLNANKNVDGIIVQLPLPKNIIEGNILSQISKEKDVDNLNGGVFPPPTPTGIVEILKNNDIDLAKSQTVIIGGGRLVGAPLAKIFEDNSWSYKQINKDAEKHVSEIREADVVISATGVEELITKDMVSKNTVLVDGSGVDVDEKEITPLVKLITPKKGAVGPMTVMTLMQNVVEAAKQRQGS